MPANLTVRTDLGLEDLSQSSKMSSEVANMSNHHAVNLSIRKPNVALGRVALNKKNLWICLRNIVMTENQPQLDADVNKA